MCSSTNQTTTADRAEVVAEQRQPEQQPIADLLVVLGELTADRLLGCEVHEGGDDLTHAERGDEAVDAKLDDDEPADEPGDGAGEQTERHADDLWESVFLATEFVITSDIVIIVPIDRS